MSGPVLGQDRRYSAGIIIESWRLWESIEPSFPTRRISDWRLDSDYFETDSLGSGAIVIAQGASIVADAVERFAGAGARRVVRLGTTGGLQADQEVGDIVLPYAAIRGEGTSRYYLDAGVPALASLPLVQHLAATLSAHLQKDIFPCIGWTTDGRWVESDTEITQYSKLGIAAVDMESAALFSAAMARGVAAASVSIIADLPIHHVGAKFKGLPPGEREWNVLLERARIALAAIIETLQTDRWPVKC